MRNIRAGLKDAPAEPRSPQRYFHPVCTTYGFCDLPKPRLSMLCAPITAEQARYPWKTPQTLSFPVSWTQLSSSESKDAAGGPEKGASYDS